MATQEYLYPKVPEKDKDGNLVADDLVKFCRNILELFKTKVSKDNKNNEDTDNSISSLNDIPVYGIATEAEAIAGESDDAIITPLGLRQGLNADGSAPIYACRAWVNFNGTGTVAIRESGNVSSITDNGTGDYTINFTTAMEDANFSWAGSVGRGATNDNIKIAQRCTWTPVNTELNISTSYADNYALVDLPYIHVMVFR